MVKSSQCKSHAGFTMIELIFAIVIISITVISLPMMSQATSRSLENNLVQEAIFAASVEVMQAMSYRWDRNSAENNTSWELSRVLNIDPTANSVCENNILLATYAKRPGHIARSCYSDLTDPRAAIAANLADLNVTNLNNAVQTSSDLFTGTDNSGYGYKTSYKKTTSVAVSGFGPSDVGNIKQIETTITDPNNPALTVVLKAYSANIGEVNPLKRSF